MGEGSDWGSLRKSLMYVETFTATKWEEIEFFQRAGEDTVVIAQGEGDERWEMR